ATGHGLLWSAESGGRRMGRVGIPLGARLNHVAGAIQRQANFELDLLRIRIQCEFAAEPMNQLDEVVQVVLGSLGQPTAVIIMHQIAATSSVANSPRPRSSRWLAAS